MVRPLQMFGWYLIANGIERFLIEKIRVNTKYDWGFLHPTQAEIISVLMCVCGVALLVFYKGKKNMAAPFF
jgi:phosphatidylglycerol:prolipoprotein diacylglycerol transferase